VLTFTNKAALELKDRIQAVLPEMNTEIIQISTFHSFCSSLLRQSGEAAGLQNFRILDGPGQFLFIYSNRKELELDTIIKGLPDVYYNSVVSAFNQITEEQVSIPSLSDWVTQNLKCCNEKESSLWQEWEVIIKAYQKYRELLDKDRFVDFAMLQDKALKMLSDHSGICQKYREQYQEILVDEYQDTNAIQEKILQKLAFDGQHLTVVGDDDQSIYRFAVLLSGISWNFLIVTGERGN
jgi:DNA helicase-2/ATP-dependent DNA helicase PcrA